MPGQVGTLLPEIARLKAERQTLRDQRKKLAKDLKNAERKRSRLKKRAKLLTDSDLVAVMMLRVAERKEVTLSAEEEHPEKQETKKSEAVGKAIADDGAATCVETPDERMEDEDK